MPRPLRLLALAALVAPLWACGGNPAPHDASSQMRFGVQMAQRGLWSEAFFRFDQARRMGGGNDPQLLNNLAVASEAMGQFDTALEYYRQALALAPGNADLKGNYDRFVGFYEAFRAQADTPAETTAGATPAEPPADFGSAGGGGTASGGTATGAPPDGGVAVNPPPISQPDPPVPSPDPADSDEPPPSDDPPGNPNRRLS
jgi:hypothetical protein